MNIKRINKSERHLVIALFDQYRVFYGQPTDKVLADNFISQRLEKDESAIFVAIEEKDGKQIGAGFTQLYPTYSSVQAVKNWILNDLYVEESHRKKGIGEKLIRAAMAFAHSEGALFLLLETAVANHQAQRLYQNIGFIKQEPENEFFLYRISLKS